jgi:energy-coupling factor transporter ATP-binding protein EcfA2
MTHIRQVESNAAGGVSVELGEKTLIIGPSAGGKTTIIRAIELALAGGTSDLEGRAWVGDDPRVLALAPPDSPLWAEVALSDGQRARWEKAPGKTATHAAPVSNVLSLGAVREALTGSAERARAFVLSASCGDVTADDVLLRLPAGLHEAYEAIATSQTGSPVDVLQGVQKAAAKRGRDLAREAKGARAVVESMTALGAAPTEAQVAASTAEATALASRLAQKEQQVWDATRRSQLDASIAEHEAAITHWRTALAEIPEPTAEDFAMQARWARATALREVIAGQRQSPQACHLCGAEHADLTERMTAMDAAIDTALTAFAERQEALDKREKIGRKLAEIEAAHAAFVAARGNRADAPTSIEETLDALRFEAGQAEAKRRTLLAAFENHAALAKSRSVAHDTETRADRFKSLDKACKAAIAEIVQTQLKAFAMRVNAYMPARMTFAVESGTRFRIGVVRDGTLHTALSGAEWVAVTTAIGCAVTEKAECAVLLPEERAYDPKMLVRIMRGLAKANAQVVLTSTVRFYGKAPSGWTIIDLNA